MPELPIIAAALHYIIEIFSLGYGHISRDIEQPLQPERQLHSMSIDRRNCAYYF